MAQDNTLGAYSPLRGADLRRVRRLLQRHHRRHQEPRDQHRHLPDVLRRRRPELERPGRGQRRQSGRPTATSGASEQFNPGDQVTGHEPVPAGRSPWTRRPGRWSCPGATPATTRRTPWWRPTSPPASTAATPSAPRVYANPPQTAIDAITGQTDVLGPEGDNATSHGHSASTPPTASAPRWAWPSTTARSIRSGPATSTRPRSSTAPRPAMPCRPSTGRWSSRPGPRIVNSTMGPIPLAEAAERQGHASPSPSTGRSTRPTTAAILHRRRRPGLLPRHHQRRPVHPARCPQRHAGRLQRRRPRQQVRLHRVHGQLRPRPGARRRLQRHRAIITGTYSYLITPDDERRQPDRRRRSPRSSSPTSPSRPSGRSRRRTVPLRIPTSGTGGSDTADDITTSTHQPSARASPTRSSPGSRSTCR